MSQYIYVYNPIEDFFDLVNGDTVFHVKDPVDTYNDLPLTGNAENDIRLVKDTDVAYTWSIAASSGLITDWKTMQISSIDWSAIQNGPASTPAEIDDAVAKKHANTLDHTQDTDTKLDEGGANEVTAAQVKSAVDDAHTHANLAELVKVTDADNMKLSGLGYVIDGSEAEITTGIKGDIPVPFDCVIQEVILLADQSGSIQVDIWVDTYANYPPTVADTITAGAVPAISGAVKDNDDTLTGWTKTLSEGDTIRFNVDSIATIERCTILLKVKKT